MDKLISTKKTSLYLVGWSLRNWQSVACLQLAKIGTFQPKFDKIYFFFINIRNPFTMLWKKKLKISSLCVE